jgi:hypothetical protein
MDKGGCGDRLHCLAVRSVCYGESLELVVHMGVREFAERFHQRASSADVASGLRRLADRLDLGKDLSDAV